MRKIVLIGLLLILLAGFTSAQMTFFLIDNFEDGDYSRNPEWWPFDGVVLQIVNNEKTDKIDFVAQSCGENSLKVTGKAKSWYVGGFGANINVDASEYTRLQFDLYGNSESKGKIKIELYEDDNGNSLVEQDQNKGWQPTKDDVWATEINVLGKGFTRYSIPFTAFTDKNIGIGNDKWDPNQKNKSGGLLKVQIIAIADEEIGEVDFHLDNILLTY